MGFDGPPLSAPEAQYEGQKGKGKKYSAPKGSTNYGTQIGPRRALAGLVIRKI